MATALINVLLASNVYSAPTNPHNMTCFLPADCNDPRNYRMMWGIVYSCLLTMFACIWTAVHPDLSQSYGTSVFKSHVSLMIISLVVPEWTLAFAWGQFMISQRISEKCEMVEGWTLTHSYFVVMNGFFDPSEGSVVGPNDLQEYPGIIENTGDTRKVAITKKEILDRSKSDAFSKSLIVLQLLWFITQYVGRWAGHLHISQLETMTLAYAALCLVLYVLWWDKPVNIQFPIHVTQQSSPMNVNQPPKRTDTDPIVFDSNELDAPILAATGVIFGGIHCLAWSFPFPTHTEMILWRVSVISITVAPTFLLLIVWFASHNISGSILALGPVVYTAARAILVVLTFTSLRSPPPSLYQTPSWSSFFPHFG
ncbi:uncharacterized protein EI90DRAFT_3067083 [Cantharellus anzutake]|uniref:uncharacterized protein n=1 Tax=Cantharellus anzutake TaxID=1750568 RepID=UPI0019079FD5|nr:uncharacterized protein EI90DRAFT_3067083 [Cantharellus anzutake]KAF8327810.1 hypothetical protein EI90DRAFT_3067083 [Cantharellus anzutake]